jgi:hypothetical protein
MRVNSSSTVSLKVSLESTRSTSTALAVLDALVSLLKRVAELVLGLLDGLWIKASLVHFFATQFRHCVEL